MIVQRFSNRHQVAQLESKPITNLASKRSGKKSHIVIPPIALLPIWTSANSSFACDHLRGLPSLGQIVAVQVQILGWPTILQLQFDSFLPDGERQKSLAGLERSRAALRSVLWFDIPFERSECTWFCTASRKACRLRANDNSEPPRKLSKSI